MNRVVFPRCSRYQDPQEVLFRNLRVSLCAVQLCNRKDFRLGNLTGDHLVNRLRSHCEGHETILLLSLCANLVANPPVNLSSYLQFNHLCNLILFLQRFLQTIPLYYQQLILQLNRATSHLRNHHLNQLPSQVHFLQGNLFPVHLLSHHISHL
jgi:hypothetical protein